MSIPKSLTGYVKGWCQEHGWTDLFIDHYQYWAFPPGAVMPLPVPSTVFEAFKTDCQSQEARFAYVTLLLASVGAGILGLWQHSPMPLVLMFFVGAIAVAFFDDSIQDSI